MHLFFLCRFAKAAWFHKPWYLRTEVITQNVTSVALVLKSLLSLNHQEANLTSIATFLWCIWKARNDDLFCRKKSMPHQIAMQAKALINNLETAPKSPPPKNQTLTPPSERSTTARSGDSVSTYFYFAGPKLYLDAAWKLEPNQMTATAGIGIYFSSKEQQGHADVFILAVEHNVSSPIQAEAHALVLAACFVLHCVSKNQYSSLTVPTW
jgi:hypothetical protein